MQLKLDLQSKVEEFFFVFLTDKTIQQSLKREVDNILQGAPVSTHSTHKSSSSKSRPISPPAPLPSSQQPRSPRFFGSNTTRSFSHFFLQNSREDSIEDSSSNTNKIPQFYFPFGKQLNVLDKDNVLDGIISAFSTFPDRRATVKEFGDITKACGLPYYLKSTLFNAVRNGKSEYVILSDFRYFWRRLTSKYYDNSSRIFSIFTKDSKNYVDFDDFIPLVQDVIDQHPGLSFLNDAVEFHSHYIRTVIARIYYNICRSWSGCITLSEFRHSNFLTVLTLLEEEDDINQITQYFSYEHFYVIYCKFWELDDDHDLLIDKDDLMRYNNQVISRKIIDRIFSGTVTRKKEAKLTFEDFVWFIISEEDKKHPRSIEYWFRCMDLDGDGYLSIYELEYFYQEQYSRMEALGVEASKFEDLLCQMLDVVKPKKKYAITVQDLKSCGLAHIFFNAFINLEKFIDYEQRDPFADKEVEDEYSDMTLWERYAMNEYELLVAEEGAIDSDYTLNRDNDEDSILKQ